VQVIEGGITMDDKTLGPGDGAAISGEERLGVRSIRDAHFLLFDLA
jgi:hypothetical protein